MSDPPSKEAAPLRLRYRTLEVGGMDIHVRMLRDTLQFQDSGGVALKLGICSAAWPMFGVIWPSGEVLANLMLDHDVRGKRVLEVGCGIALASLVLNGRSADITATDRHPEAGGFLAYNTVLNQGRAIPFVRTGWADRETSGLGKFDLIIGSDLLYEQEHVPLLSAFINRHAAPSAEVMIIDGCRGFGAKFGSAMEALGFTLRRQALGNTEYLEKTYKGLLLTFSRCAQPKNFVASPEDI